MKNKICENTYEHEYWNLNKYVLGIDEAGRGPLAGPLVVAGVVFEIGYENPAIYDSKSLSEKKREELFDIIQEDALDFEIKIVTEEEIDKLIVLDVKPAEFFTERGFRDQHSGGQAFAHEESIMGWLFGEHP